MCHTRVGMELDRFRQHTKAGRGMGLPRRHRQAVAGALIWRLVPSASLAVGLARCDLVLAPPRVTLAVWGRVTPAVWGRVPLAVPRWATAGLLAVVEKCGKERGFQRSVLRALGWAAEGKVDWGLVGKVPMPDEATTVAAAEEKCLQGHPGWVGEQRKGES